MPNALARNMQFVCNISLCKIVFFSIAYQKIFKIDIFVHIERIPKTKGNVKNGNY